ncbi:MAG TPA: PQQ-binding-like beta-propeller repeat protein [Planctomycetaceae bacterium]|nr:PQQ-binding-like beta-propeller repeat protein [Planctomycetaceae bacterium]
MMSACRSFVLCLLSVSLSASILRAGDWPQILGPNRDGIAASDEQLNFKWPVSGPRLLWSAPLGTGFAGVAVKDNRTIAFHRIRNQEVVQCFDATTGKPLWKTEFETDYVPQVTYDNGPRCVPTIAEERVIVFGSAGGLRCLDLKTGKTQWSVETHQIYQADEGYFGAGSSPLVVDDRVIVNVGGTRTDAGLVAFSSADGRELWKATSEAASYSSPIATTIGTKRVVIAMTRMNCIALDPADGTVLFTIPFGKRGPTVNAANPVIFDGKLFLSASYGVGAVFGQPALDGFKELWASDDQISSQYATSVADKDVLFGVHGRQDSGRPALRCLDPVNQKVRWNQPLDEFATLIRADRHLLIVTVGGELIVATTSRDRFEEVARASVVKPTPQGSALPALSKGLLFVRDAETLNCLDLRKSDGN